MDRIDERDRKDKLARTVVKRWNVRFKPLDDETSDETDGPVMQDVAAQPEPAVQPEPEMSEEEKEKIRQAEEIIARLNAEAAEDEAAKQAEIAAAKAGYNASTGSFSGAYGQGEMNDLERERVGNIMAEKQQALFDTINSAGDEPV